MFVFPAIAVMFLIVSVIVDYVLNQTTKNEYYKAILIHKDGTIENIVVSLDSDTDGDKIHHKEKAYASLGISVETFDRLCRGELSIIGNSKKQNHIVDSNKLFKIAQSLCEPIGYGKRDMNR